MTDTLVPAWPSFWTVIVVQAAWYAILCLQFGVSPARALKNIAISGLYAAPLGLVFDMSVGKYTDIFYYIAFPNRITFLLTNWIFSYGFAIASVRIVPIVWISINSRLPRPMGAIPFVIAVLGLYRLPTYDLSPLLVMYLAGGLLLVAGEALLWMSGKKGPLLQLTSGTCGSFLRLLGFSIATGLVYETANYVSPLWIWRGHNPLDLSTAIQIVGLGYFVLLHACLATSSTMSSLAIYGKSCFSVR